MRAIGFFVLGALVAYCLIFFGWMWLSDLFDVSDNEGGKMMSVMLVFAPVGAIVAGSLLALVTRRPAVPPPTSTSPR